jgi:molybdopterin converting factor small subunit
MKVLFFGEFRNVTGVESINLSVEDLNQLLEYLIGKYQQINTILEYSIITVNLQMITGNRILNDDDEIAFLPPVSGG